MGETPQKFSQCLNDKVDSVWTVETLRIYIMTLMDAFDLRMSERHEAAQQAIKAAFDAQKEALATAFQSQKEAVNAALAAADRAVAKAEVSTEKRFENVNEFRATLADQQRTLMPRSEAEAVMHSLEAKLEASTKTLTDKIDSITTAQTLTSGKSVGVQFGWQYSVAILGLVLTILGIASWFYGKPH